MIPLQTATNTWFGGGGSGLTYILYGGIIVLIARFEPGGMFDLWDRIAPQRWRRSMLLEAQAVSKAFGSFLAVAGRRSRCR